MKLMNEVVEKHIDFYFPLQLSAVWQIAMETSGMECRVLIWEEQ